MVNVADNKEERIIEGYGSVEIIDNQGDYVPMDVIYSMMPTYIERGGILMDAHTNRHVGTITNWEPAEIDGIKSIFIKAKVFDDYSIDDMVWDAIKKKHYTGFSFGGRGIKKDVKCTKDRCYNDVSKMELWEWSVVPKPANKPSVITNFNEMAKGGHIVEVLIPHIVDGEIQYTQTTINDNSILATSAEFKKSGDDIIEVEKSNSSSNVEDLNKSESDDNNAECEKEESEMADTNEKEEIMKEGESPAVPPAEAKDDPLNAIMQKLDEMDQRIANLEGGDSEKAELDEKPDEEEKPPIEEETEKAESVKTVTTPEPQAQQEDKELGNDNMKKEELVAAVQGVIQDEFKKMGFVHTGTPKPDVDTKSPTDQIPTFGDMMKGDSGKIDIHAALGGKSFKELDMMTGRLSE